MDIAVIGAGLAGISAARRLASAGHQVEIFEKSRGLGGRLATRRGPYWASDHGAQYFTIRDDRFCAALAPLMADGTVQAWQPRLFAIDGPDITPKATAEPRYVATPGMSGLVRALGRDLTIRLGIHISGLRQNDAGRWQLAPSDSRILDQSFDAVVVTAPSCQAAELLDPVPALAERAHATPMSPCWAAILVFAEPVVAPFDAAFVNGGPLAWVARNNSKPGRPPSETWVLHANVDWSRQHLDDEPALVCGALLAAFRDLPEVDCATDGLRDASAHRWRYAQPVEAIKDGALWDPEARVGAAGDWCAGGRVEGAFLSGLALAERVLETNGRS